MIRSEAMESVCWWALLMGACLAFGGCGGGAPAEPVGTAVTLGAEDAAPKFIAAEKREWYAWHRKGLSLAKANRQDEALYCFHQAGKAWPAEVQDKKLKARHRPDPTDTYLQKAFLYLEMNRPELAIRYFRKFESYFPSNKYAVQGRKRAEKLLSVEKP